jgi:hypothetical protein
MGSRILSNGIVNTTMSEVNLLTLSLATSKLAVIGLGYVGLPLAVKFGKHRAVVGFDINTSAPLVEQRRGA